MKREISTAVQLSRSAEIELSDKKRQNHDQETDKFILSMIDFLIFTITVKVKPFKKDIKQKPQKNVSCHPKISNRVFSQQFLNQICYLLGSLPIASDHVGTTRCWA